MKKVLCLFCVLIFSLSCATKKTVEATDEDLLKSSQSDYILEINGDSDSHRAGHLQSVYFDFKSAQLTSDAKKVLDGNIAFLIANGKVEIQIEGHTDERGSAQYNLILGEKRAKMVHDYFMSKAVDASRLHIISYGKERPVSFLHEEDSWSKNRRANFVVTQK